ncbi:MAG TPA: hypothetical protein VF406_09915 [Thermodesulfobacteriota bacterium]
MAHRLAADAGYPDIAVVSAPHPFGGVSEEVVRGRGRHAAQILMAAMRAARAVAHASA